MSFGGNIFGRLRDIATARREPEGVRILADIYWRLLLVTAFLMLVLVFLYSASSLTRIFEDLGATVDTRSPPPPALNHAQLSATIRGFEARRVQFDDLKIHPPRPIPDPGK